MNNIVKIGAYNFGPFEKIEIQFDSFNCWVVQSQNKTNSGQGSNGGGKSCLLDIVPICLMGISIQGRDLKNYVNWNGKDSYFEVYAELENTLTKTVTKIKRKFYNNTRGSELVLTVNEKPPAQVPSKKGVENGVDVKAGTKHILDEILGISEDDLLSYYLISREKYSPFMRIGNSGKIQVISRFSQSDRVDQAINEVKNEIDAKKLDFRKMEDDEIRHTTQIEYLQQEINSYSKESFDKGRDDEIERLQGEIKKEESEIKKRELEAVELGSKLDEEEKRQHDLAPLDFSKEISAIQKDMSKRSKDVSWVKEQLAKDIDDEDYRALKENKSTFIEQKKELSSSKLEAESILSEHENILMGLIECPKCAYKFLVNEDTSPGEAKLIIDECKEILTSIESDIEVMELYIKEKDEAISEYENSFDQKRSEYREVLELLYNETLFDKEKINELEGKVRDRELEISKVSMHINSLKNEIKTHHSLIETSKKTIDTFISSIFTLQQQAYVNKNPGRQKEISELKKGLKSIEKAKNSILKDISFREQWVSNFEDFKFYLANRPIQFICKKVNDCLDNIDSDLFVKIDGFRVLRTGKVKQELTPMVYRNMMNPQPYKQYSGGERVRIDIATDNSFQEIINSNSKTGGLNYYQNDEVLSELDSLGVSLVAKSFNSYNKTMLLVTHSGADLNHENVIRIEKENDISSIL